MVFPLINICRARGVVETRARRASVSTTPSALQMFINGKTMFDRYSYIIVHKNSVLLVFKRLHSSLELINFTNAFTGSRFFGLDSC